jgi:hypothetical protein
MRAAVWLISAVAVLAACGRDAPASAPRPATATAAIAQVQLRHTSVAELRTALGDPDVESADGTLAYRFVRSHGKGPDRRSEVETVRFQFSHGTLSKICRDRS